MEIAEPHSIATLLTSFSLLLAFAALFGRGFERMGVPVVLAFLAIGVVAGYYAPGELRFTNYHFAFRVGVVALVLIIFDGGFNTNYLAFRRVFAPAFTLATLGVLVTAALVSLAARLAGLGWGLALLLGAVMSSTDAAAVFSVLRGSRVQLKHRVATTLEVESGVNDPVAIVLTIAITEQLLLDRPSSISLLIARSAFELLAGWVIGVFIGRIGRLLLSKYRPPSGGLIGVVTVALALLSFGAGTLLHASGFVAVYAAAITLGNGPVPMRASVLRFHDALAWLSQITMFLFLGLLADPARVALQFPLGLALAIALTFIARPVAVLASLLPFKFGARESLYVGWVGLRGAVPIVLATFAVAANVPGSQEVFDLVVVLVIFNALVPGSTVRWATRLFKLESTAPPAPGAVLEIEAAQPLDAELLAFYVTPSLAVAGVQLQDLPLPEGAAVSMIVRGESLIPPKGNTTLQNGDHVYVIAKAQDLAEMKLLFGRPEHE
jgi:cell volume regulation protein A